MTIKFCGLVSLALFSPFGGREIREAFENCESLDQTIKSSFSHLFWDWDRLYIEDDSISLLNFVDWLGSP